MALQDECTDSFLPHINNTFVFLPLLRCSSPMESRDNSKLLQTYDKQEQYTSPYAYLCYPSINFFTPNTHILSNNNLYPMEFHMLNNASAANRADSNFFHVLSGETSSGYCDVSHSFENSDSDSTSEVGGDASQSDEEVSLYELLHDEKAKKKIEYLAAMVGVDTTEPAIVLTQVVKVLKHLKRINKYHTTT